MWALALFIAVGFYGMARRALRACVHDSSLPASGVVHDTNRGRASAAGLAARAGRHTRCAPQRTRLAGVSRAASRSRCAACCARRSCRRHSALV
jgi:hypothetical protein